jgi:hypothetical protein
MGSQGTEQGSLDQHFCYKASCLEKVLTSLNILKDRDFQVLIISGTDSPENREQISQKVIEIAKRVASNTCTKILLFPDTLVSGLREIFQDYFDHDTLNFVCVDGYANIRNTGLILAQILGVGNVVFVDDDEYVDDPLFLHKAREHLGMSIDGKIIAGVGGYYVTPARVDGCVIKPEAWQAFWDPETSLHEELCRLVQTPPRIRLTPVALGGCLVLTRALFSTVPFDVHIPRGEDIDYVISARMFRFSIFFDSQLHIVHEHLPKPYSACKNLREDIYRFLYESAKLRQQSPVEGMDYVSVKELIPYPGSFLGEDLEEKISEVCAVLEQQAHDKKSLRKYINDIVLMKANIASQHNVFDQFLDLQKKWENMSRTIAMTKKLRQECLALVRKFP